MSASEAVINNNGETLYGYLVRNYVKKGEPIFVSEVNEKLRADLKQSFKKLSDIGKLKRFQKGIYYLPYKNILGLEGNLDREEYLKKKYLDNGDIQGYITGFTLVNRAGLTTQVPAVLEIRSNAATTEQRKVEINKRNIIVYKPYVHITKENKDILQFLDLMCCIGDYNEFYDEDKDYYINRLNRYIEDKHIDLKQLDKYIPYYPDKVLRNLYLGGLYGILV